MKSNGAMSNDGADDLVSIGEAARMLGLNPSALRYYDEQGLVRPTARQGGRRMYGTNELRRLAFIKLMQQLGVGLDVAHAMFEQPGEQWRELVRDQIAALEDLMSRAEAARHFLTHALECPTEHPFTECSKMMRPLDKLVAGVPLAELATEYGRDKLVPADEPSRSIKPPRRRA